MIIDNVELLTAALHESDNGQVEISKRLYWYFLEVLPPKSMGFDYFIFQEGCGEVLYFSKLGDSYSCFLKSDELCSQDFSTRIRVSRDNGFKPFVITDAVISDALKVTSIELVGRRFKSIKTLSLSVGVDFRS